MRFFATLTTALCLVLSGGAASAFTITNLTPTGTSFTVSFDGNVDGTAVADLSAEAIFTLTSFGSTTTFDITLSNTSGGIITNSGVTALGFDTDPDLVGASATGDFDVSVLSSSFPNGFGSIEVCFKTGQANNCNGGQDGPNLGETDSFSIALNFGSAPSSLTLSNFGVRYQRIDGVGFDGDSGTGGGSNGGTPPVPEPSAALVFAAGLLVAHGATRRRSRR